MMLFSPLVAKLDKVVETFRCAESPIMCLGSAREGSRKLLVVAANDSAVTVQDMNSGMIIRHIEGHTAAPMDMKVGYSSFAWRNSEYERLLQKSIYGFFDAETRHDARMRRASEFGRSGDSDLTGSSPSRVKAMTLKLIVVAP